jgi:hypothetical protein
MREEKDFKEFIGLLNKNNVKYLVIGGFAFTYYAKPRFTKDIDLFVESSEENSKKIIDVLDQFGFGDIGLEEKDFQKPDQIIQLGYSPLRIDILTSISGVDFGYAWKNKHEGVYGNIPCFFISVEDLIKNKETTARPLDIEDVNILKKSKLEK